MSIAEVALSNRLILDEIIARGEGHFLDFKSKRIEPAKISRTFSGFANADGGELFVGIEDPAKGGSWEGFASKEDANGLLQALTSCLGLTGGANVEFLTCPGEAGYVLRIEIPKAAGVIAATDNKLYVRRGAQNIPVTNPDEISILSLNKGTTSYEDALLPGAFGGVVGSETIQQYLAHLVPHCVPEVWLRRQRLVDNNGQATVGAVMLFDDEPQVLMPKASIKVYRYKTSDEEGTRATLERQPETIEGNAYSQIYTAVDRVVRIAESIPIVGQAGLEKVNYPRVAIHEIITNAVLHRDYSRNDDVHVRIFDNRIEVESPGVLPAHITVKNILDERFARNPKLVRLINKFQDPPNKDVGEGLNTSFHAMRELKLKEPEIKQKENSVLVILKHEKLGSSEELIVNYLKSNGEINNTVARGICNIGDANKMKRVFQVMMKAGIIERIPERAQVKAAYRRGPNFPRD